MTPSRPPAIAVAAWILLLISLFILLLWARDYGNEKALSEAQVVFRGVSIREIDALGECLASELPLTGGNWTGERPRTRWNGARHLRVEMTVRAASVEVVVSTPLGRALRDQERSALAHCMGLSYARVDAVEHRR